MAQYPGASTAVGDVPTSSETLRRADRYASPIGHVAGGHTFIDEVASNRVVTPIASQHPRKTTSASPETRCHGTICRVKAANAPRPITTLITKNGSARAIAFHCRYEPGSTHANRTNRVHGHSSASAIPTPIRPRFREAQSKNTRITPTTSGPLTATRSETELVSTDVSPSD